MKNVGLRKKNYQISFLVLTLIFFVFSLMFKHVNRTQMCLFIQNLEIHKINKFAVALKLNLNCILYVYIYSSIYIPFHINRI